MPARDRPSFREAPNVVAMADALLVVDVQHGLVEALPPARREAFLATIGGLIARARALRTDVLYVRHSEDEGLRAGTPDWEIAGDVRPYPGERIVDKRHADAFEATDLDDALRARSVDHLIVCGMQSDHCVDATARGGARRDYRVTVVEDATRDVRRRRRERRTYSRANQSRAPRRRDRPRPRRERLDRTRRERYDRAMIRARSKAVQQRDRSQAAAVAHVPTTIRVSAT